MIGWAFRKIQGPSYGQTRRSELHELIEQFEDTRTEVPISRQREQEQYDEIFHLRDRKLSQNPQD